MLDKLVMWIDNCIFVRKNQLRISEFAIYGNLLATFNSRSIYRYLWFLSLKKILFIYLFIYLEGRGGRKREKHQYVVASSAPPTRDLAHNPGTCPDWGSNW